MTGARPVVGISLRPQRHPDLAPRLAQNRSYLDAIEAAGGIPLLLPALRDPARVRMLYRCCDALVLPGGPDVGPEHYGAELRVDCHVDVEPELDTLELTLARWALEDDIPILAVCRGSQLLNVVAGGTLWQDVRVEGATAADHDDNPRSALVHQVMVDPDSRLATVLGETELTVNSIHHQAIRELGPGIRAVARSPDGLIEGIEVPAHRFALGVQCHPEELPGLPWAAALFAALIAAAGANGSGPRSTAG